MSGSASKIASYDENIQELFDLYKRFRYGDVVANVLMTRSAKVERLVKRSVISLLAISLLTGATSFLNPPILSPVWAVFGAVGTLLAAYSYIVGSGEKQFVWLNLSQKFYAAANEVESLARYVKANKITEDELLGYWKEFSSKLGVLLHEGGIEHRECEEKHRDNLRIRLEDVLRSEGKLQ